MKTTNLNYLFIDQITNFAHLVTIEPQTKEDFLNTIKGAYCLTNPKTELFYIACEKSEFDTIQLNSRRDVILFNN